MKKWFQKLNGKMQTWMYGRYGYDELNRFLSIASLVLIVLSLFMPILYLFAMAALIWSVFRTYSRNLEKRRYEREKYLRLKTKFVQFFKLRKNMFRDRKTHRYYKCPNCGVYLRVPRGRGEIEISCPKCRGKITKKT